MAAMPRQQGLGVPSSRGTALPSQGAPSGTMQARFTRVSSPQGLTCDKKSCPVPSCSLTLARLVGLLVQLRHGLHPGNSMLPREDPPLPQARPAGLEEQLCRRPPGAAQAGEQAAGTGQRRCCLLQLSSVQLTYHAACGQPCRAFLSDPQLEGGRGQGRDNPGAHLREAALVRAHLIHRGPCKGVQYSPQHVAALQHLLCCELGSRRLRPRPARRLPLDRPAAHPRTPGTGTRALGGRREVAEKGRKSRESKGYQQPTWGRGGEGEGQPPTFVEEERRTLCAGCSWSFEV